MTPNVFAVKYFGKLLFILGDIYVGVLIYRILETRGVALASICQGLRFLSLSLSLARARARVHTHTLSVGMSAHPSATCD